MTLHQSKLLASITTLTWAKEPLLYSIPEDLINTVQPGMLVEIPFGKKAEYGIIQEIVRHIPKSINFEIKDITKILYPNALFGKDVLQLITWISDYYASNIKSVAETVIPSAIRKLVNPKFNTTLSISKYLSNSELLTLRKRSPKQFEIYQRIISAGTAINKKSIQSLSALKTLIDKKIVSENYVQIQRIEYHDKFGNNYMPLKKILLNNEQQSAANDIISSINKHAFHTHLLYGITGSGKTEVYIEAINHVLSLNGDVIMLVPELALTPQTVNRIRNGIFKYNDKVLVWHSMLSDGERRDAWLAISNGDAKIVIGARSAIFSPLKNIRLIIVDEEHETSYKQSENPRYHARDVAVYRAKLNNAVCILGSATPSLESIYNVQNKKYKINLLPHRIDNKILPKIDIINTQYENGKNIISLPLQNLINDRLSKKEQTILFLNRRGYATVVLCKHCNYLAECPCCSVSLTYHSDINKMLCHLCGHEEHLPIRCPTCGNTDILQRGIGSQKLEQITRNLFPEANIARVDSDIMNRKNEIRNILNRFQKNEIDIMIGTQMIAKGLDFPNVSLVGIINIDGVINFPDFRAAERAFQLLTQVAGRAGRGNKPGHVIIQTYNPESYIIKLAKQNEFFHFIETEIKNRKEFLYPPWRHIIKIILSSENEQYTKEVAINLQKNLKELLVHAEVKNATPAILSKINNKFRYIIIIFSSKTLQSVMTIKLIVNKLKKTPTLDIIIDVDPIDLI